MQFENVKVGKQYKITMSYGLRGIFKEGDIVTVKDKAADLCLVESNGKSHFVCSFRLGELEEEE